MLTVEPMLLTPTRGFPAFAEAWLMQPKWDGIRVLAGRRPNGRPVIVSRHGQGLTTRLPDLAAALLELPPDTVVDGELVAVGRDRTGRPVQDFAAAVTVAVRAPAPELARRLYACAFDVLRLAGEDLTARTQEERLELLEDLLPGPSTWPLGGCAQLPATARAAAALTDENWEGVVLKRRGSTYRSGERSSAWQKLKARHQVPAQIVALLPGRAGELDRVLVDDELGRWPAIVWPGPIRQQLLEHGPAAVGQPVHITYSRRDADDTPREARVSLLGPGPAVPGD